MRNKGRKKVFRVSIFWMRSVNVSMSRPSCVVTFSIERWEAKTKIAPTASGIQGLGFRVWGPSRDGKLKLKLLKRHQELGYLIIPLSTLKGAVFATHWSASVDFMNQSVDPHLASTSQVKFKVWVFFRV